MLKLFYLKHIVFLYMTLFQYSAVQMFEVLFWF